LIPISTSCHRRCPIPDRREKIAGDRALEKRLEVRLEAPSLREHDLDAAITGLDLITGLQPQQAQAKTTRDGFAPLIPPRIPRRITRRIPHLIPRPIIVIAVAAFNSTLDRRTIQKSAPKLPRTARRATGPHAQCPYRSAFFEKLR
jgi:hypothetical protein